MRTDAETSGGKTRSNERVLEAWKDESVPTPSGVDLTFEKAKDGRRWNQFEANRKKFGVRSTFDESLYTTEINRDHPDFAERERKAIELAREIEGQGFNGNSHLAEERNARFDDSGADEEDKYSGVRKWAKDEARNAKVPGYVQKREQEARKEDADREVSARKDLEKSLKDLNVKETNSKDKDANSKKEESSSARPFKGKHKFNVSASFTSLSFSQNFPNPIPSRPPPPQQQFPAPMPVPVPYPYASPQMYMVPIPQLRGTPPPANQSQPFDAEPFEVKPLDGAFDYFEQLHGAAPARPFDTPVNWMAVPNVSYLDHGMQTQQPVMPQMPFIPIS